MVSGKILGISTSLVVLVIAIAIVVRFGSSLKIGERFNEGLQDVSSGINSFFDSLLPSTQVTPLELSQPNQGKPNPADSPTNPTPVDVILGNPNKTTQQKQEEIINRIPDNQKEGTQGFERTFREDGSEEFNPPDTSFFGFSNINNGQGLDVNSNAAKELNEFLAKGGNIADISVGSSGILQRNEAQPFGPIIPEAFGQEIPPVQGPIKVPSDKELLARGSLAAFAESQRAKQNLVNLQPSNVKGQVDGITINESKGGDFIIRPIPPDRTRLLTDSNNKPIETASQRANRIFVETGDFADKKLGATSISKTKNKNKNFGTNTGSGQKGNSQSTTAGNLQDRLAREAQKARQFFDGSKISNF